MSDVQKSAKKFGLLKLSRVTGIARSHLYKVINGTSSPTLEAIEKIASALGFELEFRRLPIEDSVQDVSLKVAQGNNWKIYFFNFVDAFRRTKNPELISDPPVLESGARESALLASIVVELCLELRIEIPKWAIKARPLKDPWFVAGVESLKPMAIVESPISFKRNNIFVLDNFLSRA